MFLDRIRDFLRETVGGIGFEEVGLLREQHIRAVIEDSILLYLWMLVEPCLYVMPSAEHVVGDIVLLVVNNSWRLVEERTYDPTCLHSGSPVREVTPGGGQYDLAVRSIHDEIEAVDEEGIGLCKDAIHRPRRRACRCLIGADIENAVVIHKQYLHREVEDRGEYGHAPFRW